MEYSVGEFITNSLPSFTDLIGGPSAPVSDTLMGRQSPASSAATGALAAQEAASPRSALVAAQQPASYRRWTGSERDLVTTLSSRFLVAAESSSTAFPLITPIRKSAMSP